MGIRRTNYFQHLSPHGDECQQHSKQVHINTGDAASGKGNDGWMFLGIYVAIFQPYRDLEAGYVNL